MGWVLCAAHNEYQHCVQQHGEAAAGLLLSGSNH